MVTRCNRGFLLQILLFAQHVSGTTMPIIRSSRAPNTTGSNHLYNTLELLMMGIVVPETCWANNKICNKNPLLHLVTILFPHINDDARSKPHQIHSLVSRSGLTAIHSHGAAETDVFDLRYQRCAALLAMQILHIKHSRRRACLFLGKIDWWSCGGTW